MTIKGDLQAMLVSGGEDHDATARAILKWLGCDDVTECLEREGATSEDLSGYYGCLYILDRVCFSVEDPPAGE